MSYIDFFSMPSSFCHTNFRSFYIIEDEFNNVINIAMQKRTYLAENFGADIFVFSHPGQGTGTNTSPNS